jgi:hypothetical protein
MFRILKERRGRRQRLHSLYYSLYFVPKGQPVIIGRKALHYQFKSTRIMSVCCRNADFIFSKLDVNEHKKCYPELYTGLVMVYFSRLEKRMESFSKKNDQIFDENF